MLEARTVINDYELYCEWNELYKRQFVRIGHKCMLYDNGSHRFTSFHAIGLFRCET